MRSHRDLSRRLTRLEQRRKADRTQTATFLEFQAYLDSEDGQMMLAAQPPERQVQLRHADHFDCFDWQRASEYPPIRAQTEARIEEWKRQRGFTGGKEDLLHF